MTTSEGLVTDSSITLDNASAQRLMDYGLLHYTDEGWTVGTWADLQAQPTNGEGQERRSVWTIERTMEYAGKPRTAFWYRGLHIWTWDFELAEKFATKEEADKERGNSGDEIRTCEHIYVEWPPTNGEAGDVVERVATAMARVIAKRHNGDEEPSPALVDDWLNDCRREEARAAIAAMQPMTQPYRDVDAGCVALYRRLTLDVAQGRAFEAPSFYGLPPTEQEMLRVAVREVIAAAAPTQPNREVEAMRAALGEIQRLFPHTHPAWQMARAALSPKESGQS